MKREEADFLQLSDEELLKEAKKNKPSPLVDSFFYRISDRRYHFRSGSNLVRVFPPGAFVSRICHDQNLFGGWMRRRDTVGEASTERSNEPCSGG
jgi:hypothetical protein